MGECGGGEKKSEERIPDHGVVRGASDGGGSKDNIEQARMASSSHTRTIGVNLTEGGEGACKVGCHVQLPEARGQPEQAALRGHHQNENGCEAAPTRSGDHGDDPRNEGGNPQRDMDS